MKKIIKKVPFAFLLPGIALASDVDTSWFSDLANGFSEVVGILIPAFIALALLMFVWGMVQFIMAAGDDQGRAEGKSKMIWGVIALFIIVAIWGVVALLGTIFGVDTDDQDQNLPQVPGVYDA